MELDPSTSTVGRGRGGEKTPLFEADNLSLARNILNKFFLLSFE
jgi:hypothetical protein